MRLEGVELVRVDVPFRRDIGTAAGVHRVRPLLFVRVVTDEGEGWGECAAMAARSAVDPALDDVDAAAAARGVDRLRAASAARHGRLPRAAEVPQLFATSAVDRMLAATFEMAVADAELRAGQVSLAESLGVGTGFETVPVGAVVGIPAERDLSVLAAEVDRAVAEGAARLRLKIEPGWDTEPVRLVRAEHPDLVLQVDANGSYRLEPEHLAA